MTPLLCWLAFQGAVAWLPYPNVVESRASTIVEDRNGVELAAFAADDGQWRMPLRREQVSPYLMQAIVAAEDSRFFEHHGVDWRSVASAAWQDLVCLRAVRGASTISMQVGRLRERQPRNLFNKVLQAIRAEQLERRQSKADILLEYVNRAPFGGNLVGAGAASWRYFGRPCRGLSLGEAALLAGLPQSPNRLRPDKFADRAGARRKHVLDRMLACGFITQKQHDEAAAEPIRASWRPLPQAGESVGGAFSTLISIARGLEGGRVRCTMDSTTLRQVTEAGREQVDALRTSGVSAAAIVVLDTTTAECQAAVSIGDEGNRVDLTQRARSTGSTLKPFIYAAAFDAGICGPRSVLSDTPASWAGYEPSDYDRAFRGKLSAAEALAESRNIPAMLVLSKLGVEPAIGLMDAAGLHLLARDPARYGLTLAIGGAEATPMEISQAYAALARAGVAIPAHFLSAETVAKSGRLIRPAACWQVLGALSEVERTRSVYPEAVASHVAWKTGTSSGRRDAWCAAVTRRRTVVVWIGNEKGEASPSLVGQEAAAPLALRLMAMLDPTDEPWPAALDRTSGAVEVADGWGRELVMRSPVSGQQFVIESGIPRDRQRILLQAVQRGGQAKESEMLWWFVDDQPIAQANLSRCIWWDPRPGAHEIRVVDAHLRSAAARIIVR